MLTWILVANASEARLCSSENLRTEGLKLLKSFEHPESREKASDLVSDRPGHYSTDHDARGAYEKDDPKEIEAEKFARELIDELERGCNVREYQRLIFVTPSHLYGYIKKHFTCKAPGVEFVHISKDYTSLSEDELLKRLRDELYGL